MKKPNFELVNGAEKANWLIETLYPWDRNDFLRLGSVIPAGFESYISIRQSKKFEGVDQEMYLNAEKLLLMLADYTQNCEKCFYGLWNGYGWGFEAKYRSLFNAKPIKLDPATDRYEFTDILKLENRDYYLLFGNLFDSLKIGYWQWNMFWQYLPNLMWPESKEWFVAREIDFDVTLVAGSKKLTDYVESSFKDMTERFTPETRTNEIYIADR